MKWQADLGGSYVLLAARAACSLSHGTAVEPQEPATEQEVSSNCAKKEKFEPCRAVGQGYEALFHGPASVARDSWFVTCVGHRHTGYPGPSPGGPLPDGCKPY